MDGWDAWMSEWVDRVGGREGGVYSSQNAIGYSWL